MLNFVKSILNFVICHVLYKVEYINKKNESDLKKCVICPNHSSTVEAFYIYTKTKNLNIMAKAEHFSNKPKAAILKWLGLFPVKRGQKDLSSMLHAIRIFKADSAKLMIFPEGTRVTDDFKKSLAHTGPLYIAYKAGVPVVPVYIDRMAKKFSKVRVIYGNPIYITDEMAADKKLLLKVADKMIDDIYFMGGIDRQERIKIDSKK
ncbi:MAG: lysophospholipid acyltransferase family protein [Clostridia bacterium]